MMAHVLNKTNKRGREKSNGIQKTISKNLLLKILRCLAEFLLLSFFKWWELLNRTWTDNFCDTFNNTKWNDMCGEKNTEKNFEFQRGFEPTTFRTLVRCSKHWATENSVVSGSIVGWHNYRITQSHYVKWTHNINCIAQSHKYCMSNE